MESLHSIWHQYVLDPAAADDVDSLTETADALFMYIRHTGLDHMDLTTVAAQPVHPVHLAVVLRITSQWRDQIPGWSAALAAAKSAAGDDAADVLMGLI